MKTKKIYLWMAIALCFTTVLPGCEGPEGPEGPAGAQGPQGIQGIQGPAGNANVTLYTYGQATFTSILNLNIPGVTATTMNNSIVLSYNNPSNESESAWYPMPGFGSMGVYNTRTFWYSGSSGYDFVIKTLNPDGTAYTSSVTFRAVRIFIIPASTTVPVIGSAPSTGDAISLKKVMQKEEILGLSYQEACEYFGVEE